MLNAQALRFRCRNPGCATKWMSPQPIVRSYTAKARDLNGFPPQSDASATRLRAAMAVPIR